MFYANNFFRKRRDRHCNDFETEALPSYSSILLYDEYISTVHLRSGIVPDFGSSHTHLAEFGLNSLAGASSHPVFLKDQRNLGSFGSSEQWFCTSPAKFCPIWTRHAKDYLSSVRASRGRRLRCCSKTFGTCMADCYVAKTPIHGAVGKKM